MYNVYMHMGVMSAQPVDTTFKQSLGKGLEAGVVLNVGEEATDGGQAASLERIGVEERWEERWEERERGGRVKYHMHTSRSMCFGV